MKKHYKVRILIFSLLMAQQCFAAKGIEQITTVIKNNSKETLVVQNTTYRNETGEIFKTLNRSSDNDFCVTLPMLGESNFVAEFLRYNKESYIRMKPGQSMNCYFKMGGQGEFIGGFEFFGFDSGYYYGQILTSDQGYSKNGYYIYNSNLKEYQNKLGNKFNHSINVWSYWRCPSHREDLIYNQSYRCISSFKPAMDAKSSDEEMPEDQLFADYRTSDRYVWVFLQINPRPRIVNVYEADPEY